MKTTLSSIGYGMFAAALVAGSCLNTMAAEGEYDVAIGFHSLSPTRDMDWDSGGGLDIQGRIWKNDHLGFALAGSFETWNAVSVISEVEGQNSYSYTAISGDAAVNSIGASVLYRSSQGGDVRLIIDLGLRYASISSAVYAEGAYDGPGGPNYSYDKIEIDDTLLFAAGAALEFSMTRNVSLELSIRGLVDLNKPEETFLGESLGDTDFGAVTFGIGLVCRL